MAEKIRENDVMAAIEDCSSLEKIQLVKFNLSELHLPPIQLKPNR